MAAGGFDWELCVICQTSTSEALQCPAQQKHRRADIGCGYTTVARNLYSFSKLGIDTPVTQINTNSLRKTLSDNQGKWHKKCQLKFNKKALEKTKRKHKDKSELPKAKFTRASVSSRNVQQQKSICFFCEEGKDSQQERNRPYMGYTILHDVSGTMAEE